MSAIGIIGGMGPQASAHLLDLLVTKAPRHMVIESDSDFPEFVLLSEPVPNFVNSKENMDRAAQILKTKLPILENANCVVAGIACNTAHQFLSVLQTATTVEFISIPQEVGKVITECGFKHVGLLGSPSTINSRLFDDAVDTQEILRPPQSTTDEIENLIRMQLAGNITHKHRKKLAAIVNTFIKSCDLDIVILGCTELPLILGEHPHAIDTLSLLADKLLSRFVEKTKGV